MQKASGPDIIGSGYNLREIIGLGNVRRRIPLTVGFETVNFSTVWKTRMDQGWP